MKKVFIVFYLFLVIFSSEASIINVPANYSTIQAAINASNYGDTVLVAPGTYFENINFRRKNIVLTSLYYQNNNPSYISSTILNGSIPIHPDSASVIIISGHQDTTCVVQGFTITQGNGTKWRLEHINDDLGNIFREGGGILIADTSNVTIQNNIIINNNAYDTSGVTNAGGGGIRIGDSHGKVLNNYFIQNSGYFGTALVLHYCACNIKNNVFCFNYGATSYGACTIWAECYNSGPTDSIINNTITRNSVIFGYCGVYNNGNNITVKNNIIWGNTGGNGVEFLGPITQSYNDVENTSGIGNINLNPQFDDSNYILLPSSPCVDAGDNSSVYNDIQDPQHSGFALYPSRGTLRNDMGAYGGPLTKILSANLIGIKQISSQIPKDFSLSQNYPNPFNPSTNIRFSVPSVGNTYMRSLQLKIYNIVGKEVETLVRRNLSPGIYEVNWNASNYPSGVYFYELEAGSFVQSKKMILIK